MVVVVIVVDVAVWVGVIAATAFVSLVFEFLQFVLAAFSTEDSDFCNVLAFYTGGTLVCVCWYYCLWVVDSQCLSVGHQGLSNRSAVIPFLGV